MKKCIEDVVSYLKVRFPESIKDSRERSNRIVTKKDKKGGWVYDEIKGTVSPNI